MTGRWSSPSATARSPSSATTRTPPRWPRRIAGPDPETDRAGPATPIRPREAPMKTGMNLLLWTTELKPEHDGLLDAIKAMGFDSVEVPVFALDDPAPYDRLGKRLKGLGLAATAVTIMGPEANPISPDPAIRAAAVARLDRVLDLCARFDCEILCGPTHSAIGHFSGAGPTADEFAHGVDTLRKAAEIAQGRGIRIAVEYLNRFENYFLTTATDTARFVRAVDHPAL